jgi:hypothetical protein
MAVYEPVKHWVYRNSSTSTRSKVAFISRSVAAAAFAGVAPSSAIFMAVYEPVKHWVYRNSSEEQHWLGPVLAGMAAGAAASLTRVPTEVVKQRLQTREFAGALSAVSSWAQ